MALAIFLGSLGGASVSPAAAASLSDRLPAWTRIEGIDSLLVEKHDTPLVSVAFTFPSGSYLDPPGKSGLAALFGEMLLRGTKKRTRDQIETELDFLGASLGADAGFHSFALRGRVLRRNLPSLLSLMFEVLTEASFPSDELEKEKEEEISQLHLRLEDDAQLAGLKFREALFRGHPYGRDPGGTVAGLRAVTRQDLLDFFRTRVHRGGTLVTAAGDMEPERFREMVGEFARRIPAGEADPKPIPFEGKLRGRSLLLVDKPERTQTQFFIGQPGIPATHPDFFPLRVFLHAFGGHMFQAHYMQEIRVKRGWSYGAYASLDTRRDGGSVFLYTFPAVKDTVPALKLSLELLENAVTGDGLTDEAIRFARTNLVRAFPFLLDTPEKVMSQRIQDRLLGRPDDFLETYLERVDAVTVAQARQAARKHLNTRDLQIAILCTAKDLQAALAKELEAASVEVVPYDKL